VGCNIALGSRVKGIAMTNTCWAGRLKRAAWVGTFGLAILLACVPGRAWAQDDDDGDEKSIFNMDQWLAKGIMGALGLKDGTEAGIDYHERSPLVVPSNNNLPPPEASGKPANPAWPVDPDEKRRREAIAARKKATKVYEDDEEQRALMPHELNPAGRTATRNPNATTDTASSDRGNLLPSQLGYGGGLFSLRSLGFGSQQDEVGTFTKEPPRETLAEPPAGYQTPSAAEPYGVTKRVENKLVKPDRAVGTME
jgi:hypothetical protein